MIHPIDSPIGFVWIIKSDRSEAMTLCEVTVPLT